MVLWTPINRFIWANLNEFFWFCLMCDASFPWVWGLRTLGVTPSLIYPFSLFLLFHSFLFSLPYITCLSITTVAFFFVHYNVNVLVRVLHWFMSNGLKYTNSNFVQYWIIWQVGDIDWQNNSMLYEIRYSSFSRGKAS